MSGKIVHLKTLYVGSSAGDNTNSLSNGQMEIGGASYFVGAVDMSSTLAVDGALTASGGIAVTGTGTISSTLGVTGAVSLSSTLTTTGATTLLGTLAVTGAVTLSSTVSLGAGFVTVGALFLGSNVFTTTATGDTVSVAGLLATDRVQAVPYGASISVNDVLSVVTTGGSFTVHRPNTSGTSALTYFYTIYRPV